MILSYSRAHLVVSGLISGAGGGWALLTTLPRALSHLDEIHNRLTLLLTLGAPVFGGSFLAFGLFALYRASTNLEAIRTDARHLYVTTLFGTTAVAWDDFREALYVRHPKSRAFQILVRYHAAGKLAQQTVHLSMAEKPPGGFGSICERIEDARHHARCPRPPAPQGTSDGAASPARPVFGRKRA